MCYQAAFGAEHLLFDKEAAYKYFKEEFENTKAENVALFEELSPFVARVNIAAWKYNNLPSDWLFEMFLMSANVESGGEERFFEYLEAAEKYAGDYVKAYLEKGVRALHHTSAYRESERPAYRIVSAKLVRLIPVLQRVGESTRIIAIDGRAASGKSTAAAALCKILGAGVIHMDDFFLPPSLRTGERLAQAGGNVHRERFTEEVLPNLKREDAFSYNVFDCSVMAISGKRDVARSKIKVIEGAYSLHPAFGDYADIKVFSTISPDEQMERIIARNGERMAKMFKEKWIPMEEAYYKAFDIEANSDIVI